MAQDSRSGNIIASSDEESNAFIAALLTALNTIPDGETVGNTTTASESMSGATHGTATSGKQICTDLL